MTVKKTHTAGKTLDPLHKVTLDPLFMKQLREREGEGEGGVEKITHQLKEEQKCNGKKTTHKHTSQRQNRRWRRYGTNLSGTKGLIEVNLFLVCRWHINHSERFLFSLNY